MSDSKQTDHWDILASELGAEPLKKEPDESPQVEDNSAAVAESAAAGSAVSASPSVPSSPRASRPKSNWAALAVELGIEVEAEAPRPAAPAELPRSEATEKKVDISVRRPTEEGEISSPQFGPRSDHFETARKPFRREPGEPSEKKSHRHRRRHRKDQDQDRHVAKEKKHSLDREREAPAEDDSLPLEPALETADAAGMAPEQSADDKAEKKHGKRRRTHRGSRKRKKKTGEIALEKTPQAIKGDASEQADFAETTEISRASAPEEEFGEEELEEGDKRKGKSAFRVIPTWGEAIGIIVAKNMESRPRRHGGGSSQPRGAAPRGKPRK